MKIDLYYFSGTGNTAWVAHQLAERLLERGDGVTVVSCEQMPASVIDPAACDMMGIAFPVHASFAPSIFRDFLRDLPPVQGKPLFVITTAGFAAGDTAWYAAKLLQAKGCAPFLMSNVMMANNLRLPLLSPLPIPTPEEMSQKLAQAARKIDRLADRIHRRQPYVEGAGIFGRALGIIQRVSVAPFEGLAFRGFYADETCTRCGWCVKHCPVENITMSDDRVVFGDACMLCMRCYSFCPSQAIQETEKTKNVKRYPRYQGPEGKPYHPGRK